MCAGAQHLSLFHKGEVAPVKGYFGGKHVATFKDATLPQFLIMRLEEKKEALRDCSFPNITLHKIDTAHSYAVSLGKEGEDMQLGAVSEEDVPMAYCHTDGFRCATQFHPEHYYYLSHTVEAFNYQKNWLDSFIQLARYHHHTQNNPHAMPLKEYLDNVNQALTKCLMTENYLCEADGIFTDEILQVTDNIFGI